MRKYLKWLSWRRVYCKIAKSEGTPESVGMGLALGLFVGFLIPMGGQLIIVIPLAFLFKANKALAIMGTMVTNPYTSTFIYPAQCWLGAVLMGSPLKLSVVSAQFKSLLADPSWSGLFELGEDLLLPFFIGGAVLAIASSVPFYYIARSAARAHRHRKAMKMLARHHKKAEETPA